MSLELKRKKKERRTANFRQLKINEKSLSLFFLDNFDKEL